MDLISQLKQHEGFRKRTYRCTSGALSIGYGYNLDANPLRLPAWQINGFIADGITEAWADRLLRDVVRREAANVESLDIKGLNEARRAVLINMSYNMGFGKLLSFKKMLAAIRAGDWDGAADQLLDSNYAKQVGRRAFHLAQQLKTGEFHD